MRQSNCDLIISFFFLARYLMMKLERKTVEY